ncbi:hypothetical protein B0H19DRAFT_1285160 [Mycena capillaripes]|nr:hypothetical protein B0H19DRAFT_1285160 [Mycena capillaripes]
MPPIRLKSWVPRNTKPAWGWKARGSEELEYFDVPFGVKEYYLNLGFLKSAGPAVTPTKARKCCGNWWSTSQTFLEVVSTVQINLPRKHHPKLFLCQSRAIDEEEMNRSGGGRRKQSKMRSYVQNVVGQILKDLQISPRRVLQHASLFILAHIPKDIDDAPDGGVPAAYDATMETPKMREKAAKILKQAQTTRVTYGLDEAEGKSVVNSDEVCITAIGIDVKHQPEYLFSAIYGITPVPRQWRIPGRNVQFFFSSRQTPTFYHRDQYVRYGPHLKTVCINYHGDLTLSSERVSIQNDCVDQAFRTLPDLAIELAMDILSDDHSDGFAGILIPLDKAAATEYRVAFETAMRRRLPHMTGKQLYPYAAPDENLRLFAELGLSPVRVSYKALDIMHRSGAYAPVKEYARQILLESAPLPDFAGLDRLRAALTAVLPSLSVESITVRQYDKLYPTVIWDDEKKLFAFALPKPCEDHRNGQCQCLCWIGPVLHDAAKEYKGPEISSRKLWRAFSEEMGGNTILKPVAVPMNIDKPQTAVLGSTATTNQPGQQISRIVASGSQVPNPTSAVRATPVQASPAKGGAGNTTAQSPTAPPAQATPANNTTSRAVPVQRQESATVSRAPANGDEAALNRQALAQLSKSILGYDAVAKYDTMKSELDAACVTSAVQQKRIEDSSKLTDEKDGKIVELEEQNKTWGEHQDKVNELIASAPSFKRPRTT